MAEDLRRQRPDTVGGNMDMLVDMQCFVFKNKVYLYGILWAMASIKNILLRIKWG